MKSFFVVVLLSSPFYILPAHAKIYRCIGGGVPVEGSRDVNCGVSSYAGFQCSGGREICNPFIFGVKSKTQPLCFKNATTLKCFKESSPGKTTFTASVFNQAGAERSYKEFREEIESICSGDAKFSKEDSDWNSSCLIIKKRTDMNRELGLQGFADDRQDKVFTSTKSSDHLETDSFRLMKIKEGQRNYFEFPPQLENSEFGKGFVGSTFQSFSLNAEDYPVAVPEGVVSIGAGYFTTRAQYGVFARKVKTLLAKHPRLNEHRKALEHGLAFYYKHKDGGLKSCDGDKKASEKLRNQDWIIITDYTTSRKSQRMFYINMKTGEMIADTAAHGSGSGKTDIPEKISDKLNSRKTSGGFFETRDIYTSTKCYRWYSKKRRGRWVRDKSRCKKRRVRRTFGGKKDNAVHLRGLLPSNKEAWARGIVHHGATYVNDKEARWSSGCPAPQLETFKKMKRKIGGGALMYLHTIEQDKLKEPEC